MTGEDVLAIDLPEIKREVEEAFARYEKALVANDVATLDQLFWPDPRTIRFGGGENLYGIDEIRAFRQARDGAGLERVLRRTQITTFGQAFATSMTLFTRESAPGRIGRQSQTWHRFEDGWKVVAAHVSIIEG